ncbi:hypothetical protein [Candidatus Thiodictyon syntrophicum]|uniref:Uncharacterized protein n=1 Tax=Candidatus Thiodictyon syntrophicum TaxID=1166950 RepID=A0A2K8UD48_9GAMM|nr:hypothetical protein [Candidatus Thiodictyon syntrophicum]AUB83486.1 hypothetical protein THSYN_22735 [Candidatus Thiodictyon syntrophicum]
MARKAIVRVADWTRTKAELSDLARRAQAGEALPEADYQLGFASAAQLFDELTPARLAMLDLLKELGPVSIATLAGHLGHDSRQVQIDIAKLLDLALVEQDAAGLVCVPWEEIQIQVTLARAKAA